MLEALVVILQSTLRASTPLIFGALGGVYSERTGVVNIALEGIMLIGAFFAVWTSWLTGNPWLGALGAVVAGLAIAAVHALVSVQYKANQVVSGVAINILATGLTTFLISKIWGSAGLSPTVTKVPDIRLFVLAPVPVLGPILDRLSPFVYLAFVAVAFTWWLLFKTALGLRMRAVGEHPHAADTAGVSVEKIRWFGVLMSGVMGGLGGATLSIGLLSNFTDSMTAGRGFIALAAVVFGKWHPVGAMWACLLFGMAEASQTFLQALGVVTIPPQLLVMFPYVLTLLALAGVVGKSTAPAAVSIPYEKGTR